MSFFFSSKTYGWSSPYIPKLCPMSRFGAMASIHQDVERNTMECHGSWWMFHIDLSLPGYPKSIPSYVPCLNLRTAFRFTAPWTSHNKVTMSWRAAASSVASARTSAPIFWIWSLLVKSLWRGEIGCGYWWRHEPWVPGGIMIDSLRFLDIGPLVNSWVVSMASLTQKTSRPGILMNSRLDSNVKRAHEWLETKTEYDFMMILSCIIQTYQWIFTIIIDFLCIWGG